MRERCLVLIKPDAVKRGLVGEFLSRFERAGLRIDMIRSFFPSEAMVRSHYFEITNNVVKDAIVRYFCETKYESGGLVPVVVVVLSGTNAIHVCRKLIGATQCSEASPGTIRGDFGTENYVSRDHLPKIQRAIRNLVHASDSERSFEIEYDVWFNSR